MYLTLRVRHLPTSWGKCSENVECTVHPQKDTSCHLTRETHLILYDDSRILRILSHASVALYTVVKVKASEVHAKRYSLTRVTSASGSTFMTTLFMDIIHQGFGFPLFRCMYSI